MRKVAAVVLLLVAMAVFSSSALASSALPPGGTLSAPSLGAPNYSTAFPSGLTQVATMTGTLSLGITGTVVSTVFEDGSGDLTFAYKYSITGTNEVDQATFAPAPWLGVTITDAGADGLGKSTNTGGLSGWIDGDPYSISRDLGAQFPEIAWNPGSSAGTRLEGTNSDYSAEIWFSTTAKSYTTSMAYVLDGSIGQAPAFAPSAVPEPVTMFSAFMAISSLGAYIRRRMKASV